MVVVGIRVRTGEGSFGTRMDQSFRDPSEWLDHGRARICVDNNLEETSIEVNLEIGKLRFKISILEDRYTQIISDHWNEERRRETEAVKEVEKASTCQAVKSYICPPVHNQKHRQNGSFNSKTWQVHVPHKAGS